MKLIIGTAKYRGGVFNTLIKCDTKRRGSLDLLRSFAIMAVIICHVCEHRLGVYLHSENLFTTTRFLSLLLFTIGRLGVPFFLFLTGYLCLSKQFETREDIFNFYIHNLIPLIIKSLLWIVIYHFFIQIFIDKSYDFTINEILFNPQPYMEHMWYIGMIIGMYIFLPTIAVAVKKFDLIAILPSMILVIVTNNFAIPGIYINISSNHFVGMYGIYVILGYYVRTKSFKNFNNITCLILSAVCFIGLLISQYIINYFVWYNDLLLLGCAFFLFVFVERRNINSKFFETISKISFTMFFVHMPILRILDKYIFTLSDAFAFLPETQFLIGIVLTAVLTFLISLLIDSTIGLLRKRIKKYMKYRIS